MGGNEEDREKMITNCVGVDAIMIGTEITTSVSEKTSKVIGQSKSPVM